MRSRWHYTLVAILIAASVITTPYSASADTCLEMRPWVLDATEPSITFPFRRNLKFCVETGSTIRLHVEIWDANHCSVSIDTPAIPIQEEDGMMGSVVQCIERAKPEVILIAPGSCAEAKGRIVSITLETDQASQGTYCTPKEALLDDLLEKLSSGSKENPQCDQLPSYLKEISSDDLWKLGKDCAYAEMEASQCGKPVAPIVKLHCNFLQDAVTCNSHSLEEFNSYMDNVSRRRIGFAC